nr:restriction endonuclease subunit S [Anaerolineaceae bacterium]
PASVLLERIKNERRRQWEKAELAKIKAKGKAPKDDKWKKKYQEPDPVDDSELPELPEGWCWASFDELTALVTSGSRGWAKFYSSNGPIFIRAQDINQDYLNLSDTAHVELPKKTEGIRTRVAKGDLLITITGANVTKTAMVENEIEEAYVSQHVALTRPVSISLSDFMHLWAISQENGRKILMEKAYGGGKPGLNLGNIKALPIALAPKNEQKVIIEKVGSTLSSIGTLTAMNENFQKLERLNQSILSKAFRGELVPQDPNDEPASVLLERIRAERGDRAKTRRKAK